MSLKGKLIVLTWFDGKAILLPDLCNVIGCYTVNYPVKITEQHKTDGIIVVTHNANFAVKKSTLNDSFFKRKSKWHPRPSKLQIRFRSSYFPFSPLDFIPLSGSP